MAFFFFFLPDSREMNMCVLGLSMSPAWDFDLIPQFEK